MEEETKKPNYKGVWGSGYHKGYRECADLLREENMNAAKIKKISEGLTSIAAKVLDCVPYDEVSRTFVLQEMKRRGCTQPQTMIFGCLDTLTSLGLVKEHTAGQFVKVKANKPGRPPKKPELVPTPPKTDPEIPLEEVGPSNLEKLIRGDRVTKPPRDPMDIIVEMRERFEAAMFEICEYIEMKSAEEAKRMKQLNHFKALMASINEDNE